MGVNGFSFQNKAVSFFNNCGGILGPRKMYSDVYSFGDLIVPKSIQNKICKEFAPEQPFNQKSDNFLYLEKIHSLVISSLMDEEIMG